MQGNSKKRKKSGPKDGDDWFSQRQDESCNSSEPSMTDEMIEINKSGFLVDDKEIPGLDCDKTNLPHKPAIPKLDNMPSLATNDNNPIDPPLSRRGNVPDSMETQNESVVAETVQTTGTLFN